MQQIKSMAVDMISTEEVMYIYNLYIIYIYILIYKLLCWIVALTVYGSRWYKSELIFTLS